MAIQTTYTTGRGISAYLTRDAGLLTQDGPAIVLRDDDGPSEFLSVKVADVEDLIVVLRRLATEANVVEG